MVNWDLAVIDEAHRLRNVYKKSNKIAKILKETLSNIDKVLLTATPLQNSLLELFGLVSFVDERVFGDLDSFRIKFGRLNNAKTFNELQQRIKPVCKRTLRKEVKAYVPYTKRIPMVETFTPSDDEQTLYHLVSEYLQRPYLNALPGGQRQLVSMVMWKLLASSSFAIAGALNTIINRLEQELQDEVLYDELNNDYESFSETADEWAVKEQDTDSTEISQSIRDEIEELKTFKKLAENIPDNSKGKALLKLYAGDCS